MQVAQNIVIPITNYRNVLLGEPACSTFVRLFAVFCVLSTVDFDCEPQTWTIEVQRERTDRMLPSEMKAIQLITTQRMP